MNDNIVIDASLRLISSAIDEYADWHTLVLRHVFYPEYATDLPHPEIPKSISGLRELLRSEPDLRLGEIDRVFNAVDDLHTIAYQSIELAQLEGGASMTQPQFSNFTMLYDDMIHRLHDIERSRYLSGFGYDVATGLRSGTVLFQELTREMERVARRGRSFSLALAQLDKAQDLREHLGEKFPDLQHYIGRAILFTIRTFDDAYHLENDEFVVSLKQSDILGAQRFVLRLREYFEGTPFIVDDTPLSFTLSFCVAEPVAGENLPEFLDMMRQDLGARAEKTTDALVYYEEESPIRRFLRDQKTS